MSPQLGDHLVSPRMGSIYTHHGLYIGGGRVIHYAGLADLTDWSSNDVQEVSLAEFAAGNSYHVQTHPEARFSPRDSVGRAQSRLGENLYDVLGNNCEHFVNWCIDGESRSQQAEIGRGIAQGVIQTATRGGAQAAEEVTKEISKLAGKTIAGGAGKVLSKAGHALAAAEAATETVQVWKDPNKSVTEKIDDTKTAVASAAAGVAGAAKGAAIGATIGTALGPLGTAAGGFIGSVVGSIAASKIVRGFAKLRKSFFKGLFGGGDEEETQFDHMAEQMQRIAGYNPAMGEELEEGFQDFLRQGGAEQRQLRLPYEEDYEKLRSYQGLSLEQYAEQFEQIAADLGHYAPQVTERVRTELAAAQKLPAEKYHTELRKLANWHVDELAKGIQGQLQDAEEAFIGRYKRGYITALQAKLDEYEEAREVLETLLGRRYGKLYDRGQGMLNNMGFELLDHYRKLAQQQDLQKLIAELGRMREAEKEYERIQIDSTELRPMRRTVPYFREEIVGTSIGREIAHILPSEYTLLRETGPAAESSAEEEETNELLELIFFKKFAEGQLNVYEFTSTDTDYASHRSRKEIEEEKPSKKGPFILCVDTSGSMAGTPERVAKTLAFLILRTALEENRRCLLVNFGDTIESMELTEITKSLQRLMDFLGMSFHQGNSVDPLEASLPLLEKPGFGNKADALIISDFHIPVSNAGTRKKIAAARSKGSKFHSVVIGDRTGSKNTELFDSEWIYGEGNWSEGIKLLRG